MFDKIKNLFKKPEPNVEEPKVKKPRSSKKKKEEPVLSAKEIATQKGEPYIAIVKVDVDPNNVNSGSFELDWNDKFVLNLVKSGFKIKSEDTDNEIVDRWFQTVCRNVALEVYEQDQADPTNRHDLRVVRTRDLGDGRSEIS